MFGSAKQLAEILGIDPRRVRLEWISSAEGTKFAEVATKFSQEIESLGPLAIEEAA